MFYLRTNVCNVPESKAVYNDWMTDLLTKLATSSLVYLGITMDQT